MAPRLLLITSEWPVLRPHQPHPSPVKRRAEALQAAGLTVEVFAFSGRNLYNYAAAWTRLRPRLHRGRYDVVHAQDASDVLLTLPKRVPLVMTFGPADSRRFLRQLLVRFLARRADAVIVGSDDMRRRVGTHAPVYMIPPDLDEPALAARLADIYRAVVPERFATPD